jgi:putative transposase
MPTSPTGLLSEGLLLTAGSVYRSFQHFLPVFGDAARAHRRRVGAKWRVDETYVRLHGGWTYVERAIDQEGQVVDAYVAQRRNTRAAHTFFQRALDKTGVTPERVTTDRAKCYPPALRAVLPNAEHRCSRSRNNAVARDHGHLKHRVRPMRGFKRASAGIPCAVVMV